MKKINFIFFTLLMLNVYSVYSADKKVENITADVFKDSKFIQLDAFDIPAQLKPIEDQVTQNIIDAVIMDGTHSVMYSQKREEGYNKNFKNFYGIRMELWPIAGRDDTFLLNLFYYNWLTNKEDKKISRNISKFNVLNETRFAVFELLRGKDFVQDNKDILEAKNFERIQAVRKMLDDQKRRVKKKLAEKKKIEEAEKKKENPVLEESEQEKLKRQEREKKKKESSPEKDPPEEEISQANSIEDLDEQEIETSEEDVNLDPKKREKKSSASKKRRAKLKKEKTSETITSEPAAPDEIPIIQNEVKTSIPIKIEFSLRSGFSQEHIESVGILSTKTNLLNLLVGANADFEFQTKIPWGSDIAITTGIPLKKNNFKLPVFRKLEANTKIKPLDWLIPYAGLEYSSLHFINLPEAGAGLTVFDNDLLYMKLGFTFVTSLLKHEIRFSGEYLSSITSKSNVNQMLSADKLLGKIDLRIHDEHGISFSYYTLNYQGLSSLSPAGTLVGGSLLYTYNFGN